MKFGTFIFPTDYSIRPGDVAKEAEDRGFESVWFPEHSHIPVEHSPYPGGGDLPKQYFDTLDLFVAMAAAAATTERIRIGSGVCLIPQRDPINTAKAVASLPPRKPVTPVIRILILLKPLIQDLADPASSILRINPGTHPGATTWEDPREACKPRHPLSSCVHCDQDGQRLGHLQVGAVG